MPRKYIRKKMQLYSKEDMDKAIHQVRTGELSMYAAAKKFKIPSTTLFDKIKENSTNHVGRPLAIPLADEQRLANAIRAMEKWGFGLSRLEILELVGDYVKQNNLHTPFSNNKPGTDWFINFRKRHRLSIKKPQPVEYVRKKMTDPFIISEYFKLLQDTMSDLNLFDKPHLIWNLDETSLSLDPTKTKVVGAVNKPCSRTTCGTGKENITILAAASATGEKISPLIVFKGKQMWDKWMARTEQYDFELSYAASEKGWMESQIFFNYMKKILIPAFAETRPLLLIYDGHSTHVDANVVELAIQNQITILKLPPHTSHLLQPLDVAVFKSFKCKWDAQLVDWQRHNIGIKMPKCVFAETFASTWQETNPEVIRNGFKKSGIYPFNSHVIPEDKYDPAALKRFREKNIKTSCSQTRPNSNDPLSLKKKCIEVINKELRIPGFVSGELSASNQQAFRLEQGTDFSTENVVYLTQLSKKDEQSLPFIADQISTLPQCLQFKQSDISKANKKESSKINIISNMKINFEELLLSKIRQDKIENTTSKKKRVAKGAEVITASLGRKILEERKKQNLRSKSKKMKYTVDMNEKNLSNIEGASTTATDNSVDELCLPGSSNIKKNEYVRKLNTKEQENLIAISKKGKGIGKKSRPSNNENVTPKPIKNKAKKNLKDISVDDSTSVSDCISIHSDSDCLDADFDTYRQLDDSNMGLCHVGSKTSGITIYDQPEIRPNNKTGNIKETEEVGGITLVTRNEEENNENNCRKSESSNKNVEMCVNVPETVDICHSTQKSRDESESASYMHEEYLEDWINEYSINENVIVRYYNRKKWSYFVGYIEEILPCTDELSYAIRFYKTFKNPLKFILSRNDRDNVPEICIVKKVHLNQSTNKPKEFILANTEDNVYFS